ncbi:MAG: response regulator [Gemmatimonadetes bacterium]|nr:response regulator [Gemmatimonadota bacterium]
MNAWTTAVQAPAGLGAARILIVDDDHAVLRLLDRSLRASGYTDIHLVTAADQALALLPELQPDLLIVDLNMPATDGFSLLRYVADTVPRSTYLPVLVLTGDTDEQTKNRALQAGARDFLTKPFSPVEVGLRIRNLLETRFFYRALHEQNARLEAEVQKRTAELRDAHLDILARLAQAAELRDDDTGQHTYRVAELSAEIATELGLGAEFAALLRRTAPLHDVGKIGIPDAILLKPGRLTAAEFEIIKSHTRIGARLLSSGNTPVLRMAEEIALSHHERWDGTGYPDGLRGQEVPIAARIVAVADVYDALTHERVYRPAWPVGEVIAKIHADAGTHFDPAVVDAFGRLVA